MPNGKNWRYKLDRRQPWWNTANNSSRYFAPSAELIGYIHAADTIEHKVTPAMKRMSRYDGRILRLQELRARRLREEAEGMEGEEGTEGETDMEMETSEEEESDEEMERFRDWNDASSDDTSDDSSDEDSSDEDSSDEDYYEGVGWRLLHGLDDGYTAMYGRDEDMDQFRAWSDESTDSSDEDSSDEDDQNRRMYDGDTQTGKQGQGYDEEVERFRDRRDDVTHGVSHHQNPSDQDSGERVGRPLQRQPYSSLSNTPPGSRSASIASNPNENEDENAISQGNPPDLNEEPFEWAFTLLLPEHDHHSPPPRPPPALSTLRPRPQKEQTQDQDQDREPSNPPTTTPPLPPPQGIIIPQQQPHTTTPTPTPTLTPPPPPPPPPNPKPKTKKRKAHHAHDKEKHRAQEKKRKRSIFLAMRKAEEWMD